jgi:hypothetical protein
MSERSSLWTNEVANNRCVDKLREKLANAIRPDFERPLVPIEYLSFGIRTGNQGPYSWHDYLFNPAPHLQDSGSGELRHRRCTEADSPVDSYVAVLLDDGVTFELFSWQQSPKAVRMYWNGTFVGSIEEKQIKLQIEPGDPWWKRFLRLIARPRRWDVMTESGLHGSVVHGRKLCSSRLKLEIGSLTLPVHMGRTARREVFETEIDFRDPTQLRNKDLVIPLGTPQVAPSILALSFCINISFRVHFENLDFPN